MRYNSYNVGWLKKCVLYVGYVLGFVFLWVLCVVVCMVLCWFWCGLFGDENGDVLIKM